MPADADAASAAVILGLFPPAVVFCHHGQPQLVVRRETHADLLAREFAPG